MGRLSNRQQLRAWRDEKSENAEKLIELDDLALNEQGLRMRMGGEVEERNTNEDAIP
jgi:hypothetical protein